jgi:threonine dehydrogenase-like Zn-dependent dehydrogenase
LDWDRILNLVSAKKLNSGRLRSQILPLEEAEKGFEAVRRQEVLKVILRPYLFVPCSSLFIRARK